MLRDSECGWTLDNMEERWGGEGSSWDFFCSSVVSMIPFHILEFRVRLDTDHIGVRLWLCGFHCNNVDLNDTSFMLRDFECEWTLTTWGGGGL